MFFPAHLFVSGRTVLLRHIVRLICVAVIALQSAVLAAVLPPPVQPVPGTTLLALAQKRFGTLSRAEEELFRAAQEGRMASVLAQNEEDNDLANSANWPVNRVVRAECVSWICTDPQASALVTYRGVRLRGMRIDSRLDLNNAQIKFEFLAWGCAFSDEISLRDAQTRGFHLVECKINGLKAGRTRIDGSFLLRGVKAVGEVNLQGATIVGDLDCEGGQFSNAEGRALNANAAKIEGTVFFRNGFEAQGEVNLVGARIGSLVCVGGQFSKPEGRALNASEVKIEGGVFLGEGFKAKGEVNLAGTEISGDLHCEGGQFSNDKGLALNADGAKIDGSVYLRGGFKAQGVVNLAAATMGHLQIRDVKEAHQMILDLRLAKVGTFWDEEYSWPKAGKLFLDGFTYGRIHDEAPIDVTRRIEWLRRQPPDRFHEQPFEQLSLVLRKMGHENSAWEVFLAKDPERARGTRLFSQGWWWYNVFGKFIGYGYRPGRAFRMSLAMILFGALLFRRGFKHDLIVPTSENAYARAPNGQLIEENGRPKFSEKYPVFNAFFYSFESFVPLLKLDQSANWTPNANHGADFGIARTGDLLRYYLYFHIASGWLLTSLWVGAITGLVKT